MEREASNIDSKIQKGAFSTEPIKRNALVFAIVMILLQIALCLIYGFLITVPVVQLNISSVIVTIGLVILVVCGFGLIFGYTKRLVWSGIGFTFFITALCIQLYPLVNDFWTRTGLQSNNSPAKNFSFDNKLYNLYLSDRQTGTQGQRTYYGNSITNAVKCALSVSVAFSSILGRAGQLECLIVTGFGTIGFELNRQIIQQNQGADAFGTFFIFTFGGFMGLGLGIFSLIRNRGIKNNIDRASMVRYTSSKGTLSFAIFGALIIFALFPLLSYESDAYSRYQQYSPYNNPVNLIVGLGTGTIGAIFASTLINGYIIARDALHGPIAGAIVVGAFSLYITSPIYSFVAGITGGIAQSLIQNLIEKRAAQKRWIVSTVSWSLFGIQGLIGAAFASGWKAILFTNTNGLTIESATLASSSQSEIYGGLISAGIGAAFGAGVGLILFLVSGQEKGEYFQDFYYWLPSDGIRSKVVNDSSLKKKQDQVPLDLPWFSRKLDQESVDFDLISIPEVTEQIDLSIDHENPMDLKIEP